MSMSILDFANQNEPVSNSKHASFLFFFNNENTCPKRRAIMHVYRVVPQTKRVNRYTCFDRSIKAGIF